MFVLDFERRTFSKAEAEAKIETEAENILCLDVIIKVLFIRIRSS